MLARGERLRVNDLAHGQVRRAIVEYFLLAIGLLNGVLFGWLGIRSWLLARRIPTPRARTQAYLLTLVCGAFVIATTMRWGVQLVELGVFSEASLDVVLDTVQLVTSVGALVAILPSLWMLRRLTASFAKTDRFVMVLTDRVDGSVSDAGLTAREVEVLEHLANGTLSDAELAEALYISPSTAATHVRNIMRKTGVRRRHELMLLAADQVLDEA